MKNWDWTIEIFWVLCPDGIEIFDIGFVRGFTEPDSFPLSFNPLFTAFPVVMLNPYAIKQDTEIDLK